MLEHIFLHIPVHPYIFLNIEQNILLNMKYITIFKTMAITPEIKFIRSISFNIRNVHNVLGVLCSKKKYLSSTRIRPACHTGFRTVRSFPTALKFFEFYFNPSASLFVKRILNTLWLKTVFKTVVENRESEKVNLHWIYADFNEALKLEYSFRDFRK